MRNNRAVIIAFVLGAIFSAFVAGSFLPLTHAQDKAQQMPVFGQMQAVPYISGLTGFFDRNTGMMYVYDVNMDKCLFIRQLVKPGEPMRKIQN
ncbi:MAG: hypothetical protein ABSA16_10545 [Thermoguttaceae bacterium]|jgi:hypothetical protein